MEIKLNITEHYLRIPVKTDSSISLRTSAGLEGVLEPFEALNMINGCYFKG